MYGILGESESDALVLKTLVRRIAGDERLRVKHKGFKGGPDMCRKGAAQIRAFHREGLRRFVVCHDADGSDPAPKERLLRETIVTPLGLDATCCIVVPVQEIEAWILADLGRARELFAGWRPDSEASPEAIVRPKEHIERLSRQANGRPRYIHNVHNQQFARHLDLDVVARKCRSFRPLAEFVRQGTSAAP